MATGPEHYQAAELALANAERAVDSAKPELETTYLRYAEVHALLANAAATALGSRSQAGGSIQLNNTRSDSIQHAGMWPADFLEWDRAAGVPE